MPYSTIEPQQIFIDSVYRGVATILVRWNITSSIRVDQMGSSYTEWSYSEKRMEWTLPSEFSSLEDVQTYLNSIYESGDVASGQILNWAKASKITLSV